MMRLTRHNLDGVPELIALATPWFSSGATGGGLTTEYDKDACVGDNDGAADEPGDVEDPECSILFCIMISSSSSTK